MWARSGVGHGAVKVMLTPPQSVRTEVSLGLVTFLTQHSVAAPPSMIAFGWAQLWLFVAELRFRTEVDQFG